MKWYRQAATGCLLSVHTNTIAGAWTHAMVGIQISNFEVTGLKRLMPEVLNERKVRLNSYSFVLPLPDVINFMKLYLDLHYVINILKAIPGQAQFTHMC